MDSELLPAARPDQFISKVEHSVQPLDPTNPDDIVRYAIDMRVDSASLEGYMRVHTQMVDNKAKREFAHDLSLFQVECPAVPKRKLGAQGHYRYAPLDHIMQVAKPLLSKYGFSYTVTCKNTNDSVMAVCRVKHRGGHTEESDFTCPVDAANKLMTNPQRFGAARTYAMRYAFCDAFGVLTSDEDTDGGSAPKPQGPSTLQGDSSKFDPRDKALKKELVDLTRDYHAAAGYNLDANQKSRFLQHLANIDAINPDDTLESLTGEKLVKVVEMVKRKKP